MTGHSESIMSLTQMSQNEIVSASVDNTLRVWDLNKLQEENVLQGVKAHFSVDYSPHKKVHIILLLSIINQIFTATCNRQFRSTCSIMGCPDDHGQRLDYSLIDII